jgi:hypothetical protein
MPTDLPPPRKPHHDLEIPVGWTSERMLNWLAVVIGIGLCLWVLNTHVVSSFSSDNPGLAPATSLAEHDAQT